MQCKSWGMQCSVAHAVCNAAVLRGPALRAACIERMCWGWVCVNYELLGEGYTHIPLIHALAARVYNIASHRNLRYTEGSITSNRITMQALHITIQCSASALAISMIDGPLHGRVLGHFTGKTAQFDPRV